MDTEESKQPLNQKIKYWKNRLVDLGNRNQLINCRSPKEMKSSSRTGFIIYKPSRIDMWKTFVEDEEDVYIPIFNDTGDYEEDDELGFENIEERENYNSRKLEERLAHEKFVTNKGIKDTYKTLLNLKKKAREFTEEKGLNALYLAFGFIYWKEKGNEGDEHRSPLLLVPVELSQDNLSAPFKLSRLAEDITINNALEQKFLNDFGIKLPSYDNDESLEDYCKKVLKAIEFDWTVEIDEVQLSLFSFLKINMYKDIENNINTITENKIIRAINGEKGISTTILGLEGEYDHDLDKPDTIFSVVDADSSQQDAIRAAKKGQSFILQGPPGTGKSQTITNMIAELLADGKKVLFVSEKMAALEVVYKRLKEAGLSDFCLNLHDYKAKRKDILKQLENSIRLANKKATINDKASDKLIELEGLRNDLNKYASELHEVIEPLGESIYTINGVIARYSDYKDINYNFANADKITLEELNRSKEAIKDIAQTIEKGGYADDNVWKGCILSELTHEKIQELLANKDAALEHIKTLEANIIKTNNTDLLESKIESFGDYLALEEPFEYFIKMNELNYEWKNENLLDVKNDIATFENKRNEYNQFAKNYSNKKDILKNALERISQTDDSVNKGDLDEVKTKIQLINENYEIDKAVLNNDMLEYNVLNDLNDILLASTEIDKYRTKKANLESYRNDLKNTLDNLESSFNRKKQDYEDKHSLMIEALDEEIINEEIFDIQKRYRTEYLSGVKRFVSIAYKKDRKTLLGYCKNPVAIKFEQEMEYINRVSDCKTLLIEKNKINDELKKTQNEFDNNEIELASVNQNLIKQSENLNNSKVLYEQNSSKFKTLIAEFIDENEKSYNAFILELQKLKEKLEKVLCISIDETYEFDFDQVKSDIVHFEQFIKYSKDINASNGFMQNICIRNQSTLELVESILTCIRFYKKDSCVEWANFRNLFDDNTKNTFKNGDLTNAITKSEQCLNDLISLENYIDYNMSKKQIEERGLGEFLEKAVELRLTSNEIVPVFEKCFYRSWLDCVVPKHPNVYKFRSEKHEEKIERFKNLDKMQMAIAQARLYKTLVSRLPDFYTADYGEINILNHELSKQKKLMPIRKLIACLPNLLPAIKPCIMMSPLSVSTYLGSNNYHFDTVIFDEASQVRTEDAICSIIRANQVIIAGDSKQLPPTNFFAATIEAGDEYEEDDNIEMNTIGAYESLLDEAVSLPKRMLIWHYRSKHEDLIAFSNYKIYNKQLITFPSSIQKEKNQGVEFTYVNGGTYDRGGRNGNAKEAEKVADMVFEHFRENPKRSLGVIAFGEVQQNAIEEAIIRKRRENSEYEQYFNEENEEAFFIKNLETVQGDERDTIIFSIGYAPDKTGKMNMNFGPLSTSGGERRLNVAITRARYNLKLVGSIMATDIKTENISSLGPKLLRQYIDFANGGSEILEGENIEIQETTFDSPFEQSVYDYLVEAGFQVATQVGCSGYRIDLAVRHPEYDGRFAIGIECDGAQYHSARTARERDRLRQDVLERMGWRIHRIWSTDWIKDQTSEGKKLINAINKAIKEYSMYDKFTPSIDEEESSREDFVKTSNKSLYTIHSDLTQKVRSYLYGSEISYIPIEDIINTMIKVLNNSFGISKDELFKITAKEGYGWARRGERITETFETVFMQLKRKKMIAVVDGKIKLIDGSNR